MEVLTFEQAISQSPDPKKRKLMLGNGFSIAWDHTVFRYESLLQEADFTKVPNAPALFRALDTNDFEEVIRDLQRAAKLLPCYLPAEHSAKARMLADAEELKSILVSAIASNHPSLPMDVDEVAFVNCRRFLRHFCAYYTLNYDILLYWALMHDDVDGRPFRCGDGFVNPDEKEDFVVWDGSGNCEVHYLHGALHLFDAGAELRKYTWSRTSVPLMTQIRRALDNDAFPLFVAEGTSEVKLRKIAHNGYLSKALRSFGQIGGDLFIYGHSLAPNDDHVLRKIERGRVSRLFVSIYGDPTTPDNKRIIQRAQEMVERRGEKRPLDVRFYDAASARVWR